MESSIHHQPRIIRTKSDVFWPYQLSGHLLNHNERHLCPETQGRLDHNIHGQHFDSYGPKQKEAQDLGALNPSEVKRERSIPKIRKVPIRTKVNRIPGSSPQKRNHTNGSNQS